MAKVKIEVDEEAMPFPAITLKSEKKETWMPESKSKVHSNCEASISPSSTQDLFHSCIGQGKNFKREINENNTAKVENDGAIKDFYSDDVAESDDKPFLKIRKPQNGFMQGYWPNPNEIDFEEFAREVAEDCLDDIPLDFPTDLPKVPGTKYVDLVVRTVPSFNCSLDSSEDGDEFADNPWSNPLVEIKEKKKKKAKRFVIKKEKTQNKVIKKRNIHDEIIKNEKIHQEVIKKERIRQKLIKKERIPQKVIKKEKIKDEVVDM